MASFTPQATASTAMAASSAGGGTRAFTDQLTSISSTQTPQPSLTSSGESFPCRMLDFSSLINGV